jgi:transposase InsO family protein
MSTSGARQYVSLVFGQACAQAGIARSMGSTGCCHDNAVAEAFFASLKRELVRCRSWPTRKDLQSAVFDDVEGFCSTRGLHSMLGYASPAEYEHAHATSRANASAKAVQSPSLWKSISGFFAQQ